MFLWVTRFAVCPCFRQRGQQGRLQGWVERGPGFCPAASPTAMAISVPPLRPCSKLKLWVFGDKIGRNPGTRRQEKLGQAGRPVSKVIRGTGADGPASGPPSRVLWGPLLSWVFSPRSLDKPRSPFRPPFPSLVNRNRRPGCEGSGCEVSFGKMKAKH